MLKIKKRCFILLACISIFFNITVNSVNLEVTASLYVQGESLFTDVDLNSSYYEDLKFLVESDIISGFPNGMFYPYRDVSKAEFIKMLVIASDFPLIESEETENSFEDIDGHWSAPYINTAAANKIIDANQNDFFPDMPLTRHEMAVFMVSALNIYPYVTPTLYGDIDDEHINLASGEYLLSGYNEKDGKIFKPQDNLIRADVCRVISRVIQYRRNAEEYKNKMILEFVKGNVITTERQLYDFFIACATRFVDTITIQIVLSPNEVENVFNIFIAMNPEKPSVRSIYYETDEIINSRFTFTYDLSQNAEEYRKQAVEEVADEFVKNYIRQDMTDREKVIEIHKYIVLNCEYDENFRNISDSNIFLDESTIDSFTAYGALINKVAVCQGNSAAFNILAKKSGVASVAISGTPPNSSINHMWNMVSIDGTIYFIDTTWDVAAKDGSGEYGVKYLLKTEEEFREFGYKWNPELVKEEYLNK